MARPLAGTSLLAGTRHLNERRVPDRRALSSPWANRRCQVMGVIYGFEWEIIGTRGRAGARRSFKSKNSNTDTSAIIQQAPLVTSADARQHLLRHRNACAPVLTWPVEGRG